MDHGRCRKSRISVRIILIQGIFVMALMSLPLSDAKFSASRSTDSIHSITGELLHREHVLSPLRSNVDALTHTEIMRRQLRRSARNLADSSNDDYESSPTSWQANVTNADPHEYLMTISFGSPAQQFVAVADTGSDLTWLQCSPCEQCYIQPDPVFDPSTSASYTELPCFSVGCASFLAQYGLGQVSCSNTSTCDYSYAYTGLSTTTGTFVQEFISMADTNGDFFYFPFWFGCSHTSSMGNGGLVSADGLVGLGPGLISFPSQLSYQLGVEDKFAYCLVNRSVATVRSSLLVFGQDATIQTYVGEIMQYTPLLNLPQYYYLSLEGISVNGTAVDINSSALEVKSDGSGGLFIDTGTPITQLPPSVYDPMLAAVIPLVSTRLERVSENETVNLYGLDLCYRVKKTDVPCTAHYFPSVSFTFANSSVWDLGFQNSWAMLDVDSAGLETWCFYMARGYPESTSVLGSFQQQDFHVLYDRINGRLGFAPTNCAALSPTPASPP